MTDIPTSTTGSRPARVIIIRRPSAEQLRVAGLGICERWQKTSIKFGVHPEAITIIEAEQLSAALASADECLLLCDGAAVVDEMSLEGLYWASCHEQQVIALHTAACGTSPAFCLGPQAAHRLAVLLKNDSPLQIAQMVDALSNESSLTVRREELEGGFWTVVQDPQDVPRASWGLAERLRWRPGGLAAKHLNRPISLRISIHLVDTAVSPNAVTWFGGLVGALGIMFIFFGGWLNAVIGTALLHVNNIIDGIDGELARLRVQTSEFGAYLDSVLDELLNSALLIAVGYHCWKTYGWQPYLFIGIFSGVTGLLYAGAHYHCKWKHGLGLYWWFEAEKPRLAVQRSTSPFAYFKKLFWKESHWLLYLAAALCSCLHGMLLLSSVGALVVFVMLLIHVVIMRARW